MRPSFDYHISLESTTVISLVERWVLGADFNRFAKRCCGLRPLVDHNGMGRLQGRGTEQCTLGSSRSSGSVYDRTWP